MEIWAVEARTLRLIVDAFKPCLFRHESRDLLSDSSVLRIGVVLGGRVLDSCGCSSGHGD